MGVWLFRSAFALYANSAGLGLAYLYSREERLSSWQYRLLGAALAAHALSFALLVRNFWLVPENRYFFPINDFYGALSWIALANAAVLFAVESVGRLRILGGFVLPWTCAAAGAALFATPHAGPLAPVLRSFRLNLHPLLLMLAYSAFATAAGVGIAFLIQERQIKSRKPTELCYRLPPIEELDRMHFRLIAAIFPVLTLGLAMGTAWAVSAWTSVWGDAKFIAAVITWAVYLAFLGLRAFGGLRGRKSVYLSLSGFAWILVSFSLVNYISQRHGFLYGR